MITGAYRLFLPARLSQPRDYTILQDPTNRSQTMPPAAAPTTETVIITVGIRAAIYHPEGLTETSTSHEIELPTPPAGLLGSPVDDAPVIRAAADGPQTVHWTVPGVLIDVGVSVDVSLWIVDLLASGAISTAL